MAIRFHLDRHLEDEKMHKALLVVLAVLIIITLFGGCQLAVESSETFGEDLLCGVFITLEYLETEQSQESIELSQNWNGNPNDMFFLETRIYANRYEDRNGIVDYRFDNIEGIRFFEIQVEDSQTLHRYTSCMADPQIQNIEVQVSNDAFNLTGTIYFDVNYHCSIYTNPVYQTPDGKVYMKQGNGRSYSDLQNEGAKGSTNLSSTTTKTVDGEQSSHTVKVEVKMEGVYSNLKVVLKQMDSDDNLIAQEVILKDNIPKLIQVLPDTEYLITEEHCTDYQGKKIIKRSILDIDKEILDVRFTGENGIVQSYPITLTRD